MTERDWMTEKILDITLEIISLLTGEDHVVVKKSGERAVSSTCPRVSEGSSRIRSSSSVSAPHFPLRERHNEQKILALTNAIIQLLTGEVPVRCEDVTVYLSMEEWEYLEGHKDLYQDVLMEDHPPLHSIDPAEPDGFHRFVSWANYGTTETLERKTEGGICLKIKKAKKRQIQRVPDTSQQYHACAEGNLTDTSVYPTAHPASPRMKAEPSSWEDGKLTNTYSPPDHLYPERKEQPAPGKEGRLTDTDSCPLPGRTLTECISVQIKEEPAAGGEVLHVVSGNEHFHTEDKQRGGMFSSVEGRPTNPSFCESRKPDKDRNSTSCPYPQHPHNTEPTFHHFECPRSVSGNLDPDEHLSDHVGDKSSSSETGKGFFSESDPEPQTLDSGGKKQMSCSECGKSFTFMSQLLKHRRLHTGEQPFSCSECGKRFTLKSSCVRHSLIHTQERPFKCTECGKCFYRSTDLATHKRVHTGEKPFKCYECGKCFFKASHLSSHIWTHTELKPFKCKECGKCFSRASDLLSHKWVHTGEKPFKCAECGKRFARNADLASHKRVHTGEKPFNCADCGKCFTRAYYLALHTRVHTGEKPFHCNECGKGFTRAPYLSSHMRIHTGEKPYKCSVCGKCFTQATHLNSHRKVHR